MVADGLSRCPHSGGVSDSRGTPLVENQKRLEMTVSTPTGGGGDVVPSTTKPDSM